MNNNYDFTNLVIPSLKKTQNNLGVIFPIRRINFTSMPDDFYSNLIDWSGENIFYCADDCIYLYNFHTEETFLIHKFADDSVSSLKFIKQTTTLCVGTLNGFIHYIDICSLKFFKTYTHKGRISCLDTYGNYVVTGSRDRRSKIIDSRSKDPVITTSVHSQEVVGVSVNKEFKYLVSGGNDNKVFVIDLRNTSQELLKLEDHKAAVKALSWSPLSSSRFISGGGTADKTLKVWDIHSRVSSKLLNSISYDSQICNLKWLNNNKILTSFGYSNNDIKLLKDYKIEKRFSGHKNRVIHFSVNDEQNYFVSGSGDSSIKIWEIQKKGNGDLEIR